MKKFKMITLCPFSIHLSANGLIGLGCIQLAVLAATFGIWQINGCLKHQEAIVASISPEWQLVYRSIDEMPCCGTGADDSRLATLQDICELNAENGINMPKMEPQQQELLLSMFGNVKGRAAILLNKMTMKARLNDVSE